jgi:hypothetical protein
MIIAQYLPPWLRSRWRTSAQPKVRILSKKDRQILPTVPEPPPPPKQFDDDGAPLRFRVYWRM